MDDSLGICLLNDSFPPTVDGVANTVLNYATVIDKKYGDAYVVVPKYPDAEDDYPFEVLRYRSFDIEKVKPYRVGYPLDSHPAKTLIKRDSHSLPDSFGDAGAQPQKTAQGADGAYISH